MKLLRVKIKSEFYKFSINESYEVLIGKLLVRITHKIRVECYEKNYW